MIRLFALNLFTGRTEYVCSFIGWDWNWSRYFLLYGVLRTKKAVSIIRDMRRIHMSPKLLSVGKCYDLKACIIHSILHMFYAMRYHHNIYTKTIWPPRSQQFLRISNWASYNRFPDSDIQRTLINTKNVVLRI